MADCAEMTMHGEDQVLLICSLPEDHEGPHWDNVDRLSWRVVTSQAIPRITQAYLTPSADLPACRDEDPAHAATLNACYPDPPEYQHPDGDSDG